MSKLYKNTKQKIRIIYIGIIGGLLSLPSVGYAWSPCESVFEGEDASGIFHNLFDILIYVALVVGWLSLFVAIFIFIFSLFRVFTLHISIGKYIKQIIVGVLIFLLLIVGGQIAGLSDDKKASDWFDCFGGEEKIQEQVEDLKDDVVENVEEELDGFWQEEDDVVAEYLSDEELKKAIEELEQSIAKSKSDLENSLFAVHAIEEGNHDEKMPLHKKAQLKLYEKVPVLSNSKKRIVKMVKDNQSINKYEIFFLASQEGDKFSVEKVYTDELPNAVFLRRKSIVPDIDVLVKKESIDSIFLIHNHPDAGDNRCIDPPSNGDILVQLSFMPIARQNNKTLESWVFASEGLYVVTSNDSNKNFENDARDLAIAMSKVDYSAFLEPIRKLEEEYKAFEKEYEEFNNLVFVSEFDTKKHEEYQKKLRKRRSSLNKKIGTGKNIDLYYKVMKNMENYQDRARKKFPEELIQATIQMNRIDNEFMKKYGALLTKYNNDMQPVVFSKNCDPNEALKKMRQFAEPLRVEIQFYSYEELLGEE